MDIFLASSETENTETPIFWTTLKITLEKDEMNSNVKTVP